MLTGVLLFRPDLSEASRGQWSALVGGVPLLRRQLRLLRAVGATRCAVVAPEAWQADIAHAIGREAADVHWCSDPQAVGAGPAIWLGSQSLYERRVFGRLKSFAHSAITHAQGSEEGSLAWQFGPPDDAIYRWARGESTELPVIELGAGDWVGDATDEASRLRAEHRLWEGCRKPLDGVVSRNFNRHVSLFVSRRIAHTTITPNHISLFNLVLGVAAIYFAARGTYWNVLLGAFLLKANSVLDGVDGELARMRIQSSVLGEWLDTVSDDVSNQGFFGGVAWGAWATTGQAMWLWLGALTVVPMALTSAYYYYWLAKVGRGDLLVFEWFQPAAATTTPRTVFQRIGEFVGILLRRDAFVAILLLLALFSVAPVVLFGTAPGAVGLFAALLIRRPRPE